MPRTGAQRFKSRHKKGKVIEMQDRSQWEISPGHEVFTDHWTQETNITVVPGGYPASTASNVTIALTYLLAICS